MGRLKGLLSRAAETMLAAVLVIGFFVVLLSSLLLTFPRGVGLGRLLRYEKMAARAGAASDVELLEENRGAWQAVVALLARVNRSVKRKPSDSIAWEDARQGLRLGDGDAVQTYSSSEAVIAFDDPNQLRVGENSMVVLRHLEKESTTLRTRAAVVLLEGEMRGQIAATGARSTSLEVVAGRGSAKIGSESGRTADFRIAALPGDSSIFSVYKGSAEVTAGGRTVRVAANYAVTVGSTGAPGEPVRLPDAPEPIEPPDGAIRPTRTARGETAFAWESAGKPEGYHLVIALDRSFSNILFDGRTPDPAFRHGNLRPGSYVWRVSAMRGALESAFTAPRSFRVVEDADAPALEARFPAEAVTAGRFVLRGVTEPGASVFVGTESVATDAEGRFEETVPLQRGMNVVVVQALDAAGNVAYRSGLVTARY
jgi:hypothetical protein